MSSTKRVKRQLSRWNKLRDMMFEKYRKEKAVCSICGQPIDYGVPISSTPDSFELDHIIPVSIDSTKELDINNVRPTHRSCNRHRSNKDITMLGKVSRIW